MERKLIAAVYARVSTADQSYAMQFAEVRQYVERMGWEIREYPEQASSVKRRPQFDRMLADARERKIDIVVVWKLDRFARSLTQLIDSLQILDSAGVRFIAVTQGLDTDRRNPASRLLMQILGAIAEFERSLIVERVRAGVAEARRKGKQLGRPRKIFRRDLAQEMKSAGKSLRQIARELGVAVMTVSDALKCTEIPLVKGRKKLPNTGLAQPRIPPRQS
jgi:putative DNA-invertase from lambdoid prophage Rac